MNILIILNLLIIQIWVIFPSVFVFFIPFTFLLSRGKTGPEEDQFRPSKGALYQTASKIDFAFFSSLYSTHPIRLILISYIWPNYPLLSLSSKRFIYISVVLHITSHLIIPQSLLRLKRPRIKLWIDLFIKWSINFFFQIIFSEHFLYAGEWPQE